MGKSRGAIFLTTKEKKQIFRKKKIAKAPSSDSESESSYGYAVASHAFPTAQDERSAAGTTSDIINLRLLLLLLLHERSADFETVGVRRACLQDRW